MVGLLLFRGESLPYASHGRGAVQHGFQPVLVIILLLVKCAQALRVDEALAAEADQLKAGGELLEAAFSDLPQLIFW